MGDKGSFTDDELVSLLKEGNSPAFESIYNRYWDRLFDYTHKRLNNTEICEEVVQEIFIKLWEKRETLVLTTGLMNYLFSAARYSLIDQYRKQLLQNTFIAASKNKPGADNSTEDNIFVKDLQRYLEDLIGSLPPKCRSVYELSRLEYKSNKEIAEILNISEKTVEGHLTKALQRLRLGMGDVLVLLIACLLK
ncbi:RNA polymerase sigma-70 factor, ECF subfamily [Mucilaginibacter gossypiicola]|uniref:RNA polymerase sigma-70 factor, ECF subfamily n=1 Tax=Mucilaginibacter gossypiicola TaxID=551995 RepID=A0A1H8LME8_9SPHI|nr:RNA polymerase sigma-70 factor [Mucilaginibacter gossypiicola]SEO06295.1 RNA polymerase sigma-70 factor, ECF subfamily [Mucilaginibacter gossypiicola]